MVCRRTMFGLYGIPLAVFLPHVVEEWRGFPEWATRHFGATSRPYYVYSHIVLIAAELGICSEAMWSGPGSTSALLATAIQVVLATNGVFHLVTTALFREYSPGVVTGTLLFFPSTWYVLARTIGEGLLSDQQLVAAIALGVAVGAAVIGSLWLPMDLDWKLRRGTPKPQPDGTGT